MPRVSCLHNVNKAERFSVFFPPKKPPRLGQNFPESESQGNQTLGSNFSPAAFNTEAVPFMWNTVVAALCSGVSFSQRSFQMFVFFASRFGPKTSQIHLKTFRKTQTPIRTSYLKKIPASEHLVQRSELNSTENLFNGPKRTKDFLRIVEIWWIPLK